MIKSLLLQSLFDLVSLCFKSADTGPKPVPALFDRYRGRPAIAKGRYS